MAVADMTMTSSGTPTGQSRCGLPARCLCCPSVTYQTAASGTAGCWHCLAAFQGALSCSKGLESQQQLSAAALCSQLHLVAVHSRLLLVVFCASHSCCKAICRFNLPLLPVACLLEKGASTWPAVGISHSSTLLATSFVAMSLYFFAVCLNADGLSGKAREGSGGQEEQAARAAARRAQPQPQPRPQQVSKQLCRSDAGQRISWSLPRMGWATCWLPGTADQVSLPCQLTAQLMQTTAASTAQQQLRIGQFS